MEREWKHMEIKVWMDNTVFSIEICRSGLVALDSMHAYSVRVDRVRLTK